MNSVMSKSTTSVFPKLRLVAFNDVYELTNLPRLQTFITQVKPDAVILAGDFLSPSTLSAVDGGKGMISTLRAVGLTHCCLGNHEADLPLSKLYKRLMKLGQTVTIVNSNVARGPLSLSLPDNHNRIMKNKTTNETLEEQLQQTPDWLRQPQDWMPEYSYITSSCQRVKVALVGLLSDEPGVFRDDTFRGAPIADVVETYKKCYEELVERTKTANFILPVTHQTIQRDEELARSMIEISKCNGLILGGHEHFPCDTTISSSSYESTNGANDTNYSVQILKSGCEAKAVHLVDLTFDLSSDEILIDRKVELVELKEYTPSVVVSNIVQERMAILDSLEAEDIVHAGSLLSPGASLSSKGTRYRQTTVGAVFCTAIKDELEVDVAIINGATIKGETDYIGTSINYASLKKELPFPTKIVVIPMKRWELHDAIYFSRTRNPDITPEEEMQNQSVHTRNNGTNQSTTPRIERKGYIQVDTEFDRVGFHTGDQNDDLMVALPRNLLAGFCNIEPLIQVGKRLKEQGKYPENDDQYIRAIDLIVRHFCKERWFEMVHEMQFTDIDTDKKGYLSRNDVKRILQQTIGHEPASFLVDNMIAAMDVDENGIIDAGEFSYLLATMERERSVAPIRFD